ncbi:molybdenum cofactor guanylyltransferase [Maritalea mediterranea]|uniref:Molybdenum cofactor guanylyltransferase n=1 Tax=Maritalea mediterranea TaxID=2909667 RepID=A0ABS9E9Y6_9HYPH|nr:molybdenum cofactor guanylyltransferase [Maritalea mediterranea]MCF4098266.1 molybdenum cofactor guanylyltransferase [Maritalea mediterranea]
MEIFGIILAGGEGTRLGGVDKARLRLGKRSFLHHVKQRLESQCQRLVYVGPHEHGALTSLPSTSDHFDPPIGPLGGIYTGARWASSHAQQPDHSWILTAPVDGPFFPSDFVERVRNEMEKRAPIIGRYGTDIYPVCGLWPLSQALEITRILESQEGFAVRPVLHHFNAQEHDFKQFYDENPFANANRMNDLLALQSRYAAQYPD